jgi:hypothetical protein
MFFSTTGLINHRIQQDELLQQPVKGLETLVLVRFITYVLAATLPSVQISCGLLNSVLWFIFVLKLSWNIACRQPCFWWLLDLIPTLDATRECHRMGNLFSRLRVGVCGWSRRILAASCACLRIVQTAEGILHVRIRNILSTRREGFQSDRSTIELPSHGASRQCTRPLVRLQHMVPLQADDGPVAPSTTTMERAEETKELSDTVDLFVTRDKDI